MTAGMTAAAPGCVQRRRAWKRTNGDTWNEFVFDNYLYSYNDLATFNADGSRSLSVINSGSGGGGSAWAGSGGSSYFEDYNTSPWRTIIDDSYVYDVSGWASYGYSYNDSLLSTIAADGTTTTTGFIHDEGSADGESTLHEHTFESFEEWVTELDASSHTYDETDTDRTTIATLDEDIDKTDSFFADGTKSTVDNSTSNSGSTTTETATAGGFWSVTLQGTTTSGSYGTLSNPTQSAYLLAFGSAGSGGSGTVYANSTDSSAALGLAIQQSGLQVSTPTDPNGSAVPSVPGIEPPDWLNALGSSPRQTGELDMANALAWGGTGPFRHGFQPIGHPEADAVFDQVYGDAMEEAFQRGIPDAIAHNQAVRAATSAAARVLGELTPAEHRENRRRDREEAVRLANEAEARAAAAANAAALAASTQTHPYGTEGYLEGVGNYFAGYGDAVGGFFSGLGTMIAHPIDTTVGLGNAIWYLGDTFDAIKEDIVEKSGTNRGRGQLIGDVMMGVATGGTVKAVKEAERVADLANKLKRVIGRKPSPDVPSGRTLIDDPIDAPSRGLHDIASEIRTSGHPIAAGRRTIAVGEDGAGNLHVGSSNGLDRGMRAAAERLGVRQVPSRPGLHAEEELMEAVNDLRKVGTSKRIPCGPDEHNCLQQLIDRVIEITNPGH